MATALLPSLLKVLGDPTRLRILALLERQELSVGELSRCLEMAQSRVSNHLRVLREHRLLAERREGTTHRLRLAMGSSDGGPFAGRLWSVMQEELTSLPDHSADLERLERLLAEREAGNRDFFDSVAGEWDKIGVAFETGQARGRAAANLLEPGKTFADLGCGTAYFGRSLLGLCARLILVDRSAEMLQAAREHLGRAASSTEVDFRRGELDCLPIADDELDGAVAALVLHHLAQPDRTLAEMRRVIRPGGTAVVVELSPHREEWMHSGLGDQHLGVDPQTVRSAFERAGLVDIAHESLDDRYAPKNKDSADGELSVSLPLYLIRGRVPQ